MSQTWIYHDGNPLPFLGQLIAKVQHKTEPNSYPTYFYFFKDLTSPQIWLLYAASDRLEILEFKVSKHHWPSLTL